MDKSINRQNLPDTDRLSILAAMIVLSYILEQFIDIPGWRIARQFPGLYIELNINENVIISFLVALMTAAGTDWFIREHPAAEGKRSLVHAILPSLIALTIGITLARIPVDLSWWIGLIGGAIVIVLVIIAEYIAVDLDDRRMPLASAALSAASFALFLVMASAVRATGIRLLFNTPAVMIASWLVSLRVTNLRLHGEWTIYESAIIAFIVGQIAAALNYWPLAPQTFALLLLGPSYALISIFCSLIEQKTFRQLIYEPVISIVIAWGAAIVIR